MQERGRKVKEEATKLVNTMNEKEHLRILAQELGVEDLLRNEANA